MATKAKKSTSTASNAPATTTEEKPYVKRGRGGKENFPNSIANSAKSEDIKRVLNDCLMFYDKPIVKSDEECRERLAWFFETCGQTGQLPTVEKMVLALGCVKSTAWEWENGIHCSPYRANLLRRAKEFIASFEGAMATEGKINPVIYIFRAKNYFGMKDQQDVIVRPDNPLGDYQNKEDLVRRIDGSVVDD